MARVLVVDDEDDLRFLARTMLERAGHEVLTAANGRQALEVIGQEAVDLVVVDIQMPVMDGSELIAELRAGPRTSCIPIVMWSADPDRGADADEVIVKPYGGLLGPIERLLEKGSSTCSS